MITQINSDSLFNLFRVVDFDLLESAIDNMAPSLVEYYLSGFMNEDDYYFNKRDIENIISIGNYNIYLDYSKNIYLELIEDTIDDSTQSFW
jgi:hypothetical protein